MRNLIIAANRSVVDFKESDFLDLGKPPEIGAGGLAQAMAGLLKKPKNSENGRGWEPIWIGTSMGKRDKKAIEHPAQIYLTVDKEDIIHFEDKLYDFWMRKIFPPTSQQDRNYNNFCNGFVWPLNHLTGIPFYKDLNKAYPLPDYDGLDFDSFKASCGTFADTIFDETKRSRKLWEGGKKFVVWLQDYHLMLTSSFYRKELEKKGWTGNPNIAVGQFMHTPFISLDMLKELMELYKGRDTENIYDPLDNPKEEVIKQITYGMLGNDFIGFHIPPYAENFVEVMEYLHPPVKIEQKGDFFVINHTLNNEKTVVGAYPIGIDAERILPEVTPDKKLNHQMGKYNLEELIANDKKEGRIVFGGLERLDYTKGLPERMEIFREVYKGLEQQGKEARMVQIAAISRQDNPSYKNLARVVREEVRKTNQEFGKPDFTPLLYRLEGIGQPENYRFMRDLDVLMVTTKEDGMNLVVLEGILSKKHLDYRDRGIIVVGRCGARHVLEGAGFGERDGLVYVDPSKPEEAAKRIMEAWKRGYRISDRAISYVENECRVEEWAEKNINSIISPYSDIPP